MTTGKGIKCVHVAQRPWEVRWHDRLRAWRDRCFHLLQIDGTRNQVAVDEDRMGANFNDHVHRREEAMARIDSSISWSNPTSQQREFHCSGGRSEAARRTAVESFRQ